MLKRIFERIKDNLSYYFNLIIKQKSLEQQVTESIMTTWRPEDIKNLMELGAKINNDKYYKREPTDSPFTKNIN